MAVSVVVVVVVLQFLVGDLGWFKSKNPPLHLSNPSPATASPPPLLPPTSPRRYTCIRVPSCLLHYYGRIRRRGGGGVRGAHPPNPPPHPLTTDQQHTVDVGINVFLSSVYAEQRIDKRARRVRAFLTHREDGVQL